MSIYSNIIVRKNTSVNENEVFPLLLAYLEKMTPPNHRGLIDWTNIIMSRSKIYREMMNYNKSDYVLILQSSVSTNLMAVLFILMNLLKTYLQHHITIN